MTKQSIIVNNDLFNCYCIKPKQYNGNNALFYCDAIASSLNRSWNRTMQTRKMLITIFRRELYNIDLRPTEEGKKKKKRPGNIRYICGTRTDGDSPNGSRLLRLFFCYMHVLLRQMARNYGIQNTRARTWPAGLRLGSVCSVSNVQLVTIHVVSGSKIAYVK